MRRSLFFLACALLVAGLAGAQDELPIVTILDPADGSTESSTTGFLIDFQLDFDWMEANSWPCFLGVYLSGAQVESSQIMIQALPWGPNDKTGYITQIVSVSANLTLTRPGEEDLDPTPPNIFHPRKPVRVQGYFELAPSGEYYLTARADGCGSMPALDAVTFHTGP
jgi:hypothetical protein